MQRSNSSLQAQRDVFSSDYLFKIALNFGFVLLKKTEKKKKKKKKMKIKRLKNSCSFIYVLLLSITALENIIRKLEG